MPLEFLGTVDAIVAVANTALKTAWVHWRKRRIAARKIEEEFGTLRLKVKAEGMKIAKYVNFEKLIKVIDGGVNTILRMHSINENDETFWPNVEEVHGQIYEASTVELQNFDLTLFEAVHEGQIGAVRPLIQQKIQNSHALMGTKQRDEFINTLQQIVPLMGAVRGFSSMILESTGKALSTYEGK